MLNDDDRNAIEGLFSRLAEVERKAPPRDAEAEALIAREIARQPGAPYFMAQTVLVQEHALTIAERRIRELEAELDRASRGDVFGGLFGGGRNDRTPPRQPEPEPRRGPWDRPARREGGGFLAGAAQTALGVTGGFLLGSAIGSLFNGGGATAAEPPAQIPDAGAEPPATDAGDDDFGGFDDGGGFDGGGFDFGGDF